MRILSGFMKTFGLWAVLVGYFMEDIGDWSGVLFALGLIMMISAWYMLDFSYYRDLKLKGD